MPFEEAQAIFQTQSLCPECLKRIPAIRLARGNDLFMKKTCPDHGEFEALLWRGNPSYREWGPLKSRVILNGPSQKLYKAVLLIADSVRTIASKHVRLCWK